MKTIFYTIISDSHYYGCRTDEFIKSFKKFHPDITLKIFREEEIKKNFDENKKLNFYNSKAAFAKLLYNDYDLVVNIDADHLIFDRLEEILIGDYDVACPSNFNIHLNSGIKVVSYNSSRMTSETVLTPFDQYLQGGIIASTSRSFWDHFYEASIKHSDNLVNKENDILNLLCQLSSFKLKILDGDWKYTSEKFTCYYGCASLDREKQAIIVDNKIKLDNKIVKAHHFAGGGSKKLEIDQVFNKDVAAFIKNEILR
jgi:hypothetical protein